MPPLLEPPRLSLARLPTPLELLGPLSDELGVAIHVKRDDLTGLMLSGNKVRKLEYVLAEALQQKADVVLTCGGAQSNHCRATAAAARHVGLAVELFLRGARETPVDGNLFLDLLLGARIHSLSPAQYRDRAAMMTARAEELGSEGRKAYVIPEGASTALGALGYVRGMQEIVRQCEEGGITPRAIVAAVGSGGTLAGLAAGAEIHGFPGEVIGIPVCDDAAWFARVVDALLDELRLLYAPQLETHAASVTLIDGYVGSGYGAVAPADFAQIQDMAVLTGLLLDPVYTNKAFSGLLDLVRSGRIARGSSVIFLHTGGLFGLFPYRDRMPHLMVP